MLQVIANRLPTTAIKYWNLVAVLSGWYQLNVHKNQRLLQDQYQMNFFTSLIYEAQERLPRRIWADVSLVNPLVNAYN